MKFKFFATLTVLSVLLFKGSYQAPKPETRIDTGGYWNYLMIFGLWGQVLHYLLTDTRGFRSQIRGLDAHFKHDFGTDEYVQLERDVVQSISAKLLNVILHFSSTMERIRDVKDPVTGKTLGHAIDIMKHIAANPETKKEFIRRWGMIEHPDEIFSNAKQVDSMPSLPLPATLQQMEPAHPTPIPLINNQPVEVIEPEPTIPINSKVEKTLLKNPVQLSSILLDPRISNHIANNLTPVLRTLDIKKVIKSGEELIELFKEYHRDTYTTVHENLSQIRDEKTKLTLIETVLTLVRVMKTREFDEKIQSMIATNDVE